MFHTTVTFLMFLFSMNSPMDSKFVISSKAPAMYIIFIWFLSCLNCLMILWMTLPKWFVTILIFLRFSPVWILWWTAKFAFTLKALPHTSFIWFLSHMNSLMNTKVNSRNKCLATYITYIWFLSSMNSPMKNKFCSLIKVLDATHHIT